MVLYCFLKTLDNLPDPKSVTVSGIKKENEAVQSVEMKVCTNSGLYTKTTPEQQAKIAQYAVLHNLVLCAT